MKAAEMARIYARAFAEERAWTTDEIGSLVTANGAIIVTLDQGFAIGRVTLDEAEVITIAVDPDAQRRGHGNRLLQKVEERAAAKGARVLFLEVAADNTAALRLYGSRSFEQVGIRPHYYPRQNGISADALVMQKLLDRT